jgi:hypothetical protein
MNFLLLLLGFRVWAGSPVEIITRVFCAITLLSLEMQLVTWTHVATLHTLPAVNIVIACALYVWGRRAQSDEPAVGQRSGRKAGREGPPYVARLALAVMGALVLTLNILLPLAAADPYHLIRMDRIQQSGTIAYDPVADPKLNILGWLYELVLADLQAIPAVGELVLKLHGIGELLLFVVTIAAVLQIFGGVPSRLAWALCCVVPVVFHQFVLLKNDLFGAMPALLVLAWLTRLRVANAWEVGWAGWLLGIGVGMKLTSFPLPFVAAGALLLERRELRVVGAGMFGALIGLISGGLLFTLVENARLYGSMLDPYRSLGNRTVNLREAAVSVFRFAISLFDMGLLTRWWWPGRGGWGSTYGMPLMWALAVLVFVRRRSDARRTLFATATYWLAFAAVYPDADIAHRLALAPGLLVIIVAGVLAERDTDVPRWLHLAAVPVIGLSAAQIVRSAVLYLMRA